jgi:hypothetical protein
MISKPVARNIHELVERLEEAELTNGGRDRSAEARKLSGQARCYERMPDQHKDYSTPSGP